MKLTQQQLASLAKVSTPTISRFEQSERDLQLSSVLAILGVLGMTDKRTLIFADLEFRYDFSRDAMVFWGQEGEAKVQCRISHEALEDHFADHGKLKPEAAFKKYRRDIEALARRKYFSDQRESDGSVVVRTEDVT
jgi:transcriptional regulator with XRE-family HTH domain